MREEAVTTRGKGELVQESRNGPISRMIKDVIMRDVGGRNKFRICWQTPSIWLAFFVAPKRRNIKALACHSSRTYPFLTHRRIRAYGSYLEYTGLAYDSKSI
jgi:hypothetical protein